MIVLKKGDRVIINKEASRCGVMRNAIGQKAIVLETFVSHGGIELARVRTKESKDWIVQWKYLKKV